MNASPCLLGVVMAGTLVAGCDGDPLPAAAEPAVTIRTSIDFATPPFRGTFSVTEGAELLGCDGGTLVDAPARLGAGDMTATTLTCDAGPEAGALTATFRPTSRLGPGALSGRWSAVKRSGGFASLSGEGEFSLAFTGPALGEGRLRFER